MMYAAVPAGIARRPSYIQRYVGDTQQRLAVPAATQELLQPLGSSRSSGGKEPWAADDVAARIAYIGHQRYYPHPFAGRVIPGSLAVRLRKCSSRAAVADERDPLIGIEAVLL
jgi:hypothetical protein